MKTVLITGASGGLGLALSEYLLKKNYFVIMHYNENFNDVKKLNEKYYNNSLIIKANLISKEEIFKIKEFLNEKNISLDCLINNAAIENFGELENKNYDSFLKVFLVNTMAPFLLMKLFGKEIDERNGSIINISSDNLVDKFDYQSMEYDVSKSGLNVLTKEFALKYSNAHINAILFGWLDTKMNDIPFDIKKFIKFVPIIKAVKMIENLIETDKNGELIEVSE